MSKVVDLPPKKQREEEGIDLPWTWIGIAVLILLIIIFFLLPAWKGYRTYQAAKDSGVEDYIGALDELRDAKQAAEASEQAALARLSEYTGEVESARSGITEAQAAREAAQAALVEKSEQCELLLNSYSEDLQGAETNLDACEDERDAIVQYAANRLCCIQRTFDPNITGYDVEDASISCVQSGGTAISC